ncbi:hypothetical protein DW725_07365 [Clostridiaceae bacterium AM27-36LB]|nr:hypothetical protein DW725_07365 [Clostridiaceae bacterium AM27-36LB]
MKKIACNTGLVMTEVQEVTGVNHGSVGQWLTAAVLMVGLTGLLVPVFPSISYGIILTAVVEVLLCWIVLFLAARERERQELILIPFLIYAIICFGRIRDGIFCLANDVLELLTARTGRIHLHYEVQSTGNIGFAVWSVGFLLAFLTAEAVWYGWLLPELMMIVLMLAGLAGGILKPGAGAALYVAGLILLLIQRGQKRTTKTGRAELIAYGGLSIVLALVLTGTVVLGGDGASTAYQQWRQWYHQRVYDTKTTSMPEGRLQNLGTWKKSGTAALSLQADSYEKLYLRGMTGEVYTGSSWEELPAEDRADASDLFYWLHKNDFYGQAMIRSVADVTDSEDNVYTMSVQNLAACKGHMYLPYGLEGTELLEADLIGDGESAAGQTSWKMSYRSGSVPVWYGMLQKLAAEQTTPEAEEYLRMEESYREYVSEKDLELTDAAKQTLDRLLPDSGGTLTLSEIKDRIFQCLEQNLAYDENTVTVNGSQDFLSYTLEQKKKGYSVHYATAATLMLRYYGVPARYVEGYLLTRDQAGQAVPGEPLILDETCAHAWAEYYLDGIGWIPFETTPGYIDPEEIGIDENSGADQSYDGQSKSYTQQQETMEQTEVSQEQTGWSVRFSYLILLLGILLLVGAVAILMYRRRIFRKHLEWMRALPPKEAIPAWYGYSVRLLRQGDVAEEMEDQEQRKAMFGLNEEALFSSHIMTEEQKTAMMAYAEQVKKSCLEHWNRWERWKYRWIDNLV